MKDTKKYRKKVFFVALILFAIFLSGCGSEVKLNIESSTTYYKIKNPFGETISEVQKVVGRSQVGEKSGKNAFYFYHNEVYFKNKDDKRLEVNKGHILILDSNKTYIEKFLAGGKGREIIKKISNGIACFYGGGTYTKEANFVSQYRKTSEKNNVLTYSPFYTKYGPNAYYCKTTTDLFKEIKIPDSWKNSQLLIYCNDGDRVLKKDENGDIVSPEKFFNGLDSYKSCRITNLDNKENPSIFYNYQTGNYLIDKKSYKNIQDIYFENHNFNKQNNKYLLKKENDDIYLKVSENNPNLFMISNSQEEFNANLNYNQILKEKVLNSRIIFLRTLKDNSFVYAYEFTDKNKNKNIKPTYIIDLSNSKQELSSQKCLDVLKQYGAKNKDLNNLKSKGDKVLCQNNKIVINSNGFSNAEEAYNLLIEIVTKLEIFD